MKSALHDQFNPVRLLIETLRFRRNRAFGRAAFSCFIWLVYGYGQPGRGQACLDLAKQPAVNQSFGRVGGEVSLAGRTTYQFSTNPCPLDGTYTVAETVEGQCFSSLWHALSEDHTPDDTRGNMMVVNGSNESGEFYKHPLAGLCNGTDYEFSVWGMNLLKPGICTAPLLPDLAISIETESGRVIQVLDVGIVPQSVTPTWQRFATVFTAPDVTDGVVVKLINRQGSGGCGNDLVLDDIQLKQCGVCSPVPVYVPEAFTPNNDGVNDKLAIFLRRADSFAVTIYNRWGSAVFTSDALNQMWDGCHAGSPCPVGDYNWVVTYELADATNVAQSYVRTGRVLLLR